MADEEQHLNTTTTVPAAIAASSVTVASHHRQLPHIIVAKMLTMVLQNGMALAAHETRPNTLLALTTLRRDLLLHCPFFDPEHKPDELRPRIRPSQISFTGLVVLMARLLRVMMKQGALTEEEVAERVEVRNECLDQRFFNRALVVSARPFVGDDGFVDEACVL